MSLKNNNIFNNINIKTFAQNISQVLKGAALKYWESDLESVLQAVNDYSEIRDEYLIKNIDFFSSQIKVEKHKPITIRLSKEAIANFLDISLSSNSNNFLLTSLTPLEIKILNNFCDFLYKKLDEILIPTSKLKLSEKSEKNINFLLNAKFKNNKAAFILFSIPLDRIPFEEVKKKLSFNDEDFLTSKTTVKIRAGSSKITLDELQNLFHGDIVLLEESDVSKMILISGDFEKPFSVKKNSTIVLDLDIDEEENNERNSNEVIMEKNLWDDIQIEISAEFEKVKMTIGELKQITQGQIVDLGSVFDNEISLYVENKKVAKGELVIINDRYAVCLNEVLSTTSKQGEIKSQGPTVQSKQSAPAPKPQPAPAQRPLPPKPGVKPAPAPTKKQAQDEEFDYSDFEK